MANKKVSQLTSKPSVLVTDLFPIADPSTGQLYKTTISDLGTAIGSGVSSVNGLVGAVVLDTDDIQELVSPTNKWFTDTRARAALSASSPLAYNSGTGVFSIPAATSSQNGYLTSTDWSTFNSKQAALSGTGFVKISGTTISYDNTSYLPLTGGTLTGTLIGTRAEFTTSTLVDGILVNNGSGRGIRIINAGAGYGLIINNETASSAIPFVIQKSGLDKIYFTDSGAGNFTGSLTASSFVKSGGTSSQYLMADGSVSTLTNPVTGTGTSGIVAKFNGTSSITDSIIYDNGTRVSIGADVTTSNKFTAVASTTSSYAVVAQASGAANGFWATLSGSGEIFRGQTSGGSYFIINNGGNAFLNGNLNIGDFASTSYKLKVNGTSNFTGGFTGFEYNSAGAYPAYNTYFGAIGTNFSNANSELDIWNTVGGGFVFRKQTGASAQTALLTIASSGAATFSSSVQTTNLFVGTTGTATTLNSIQSPYGILSGLIEANIAGNAYYNSGWKYYGNGPTGVFNIDTGGNFGFYTASSGVGGNNISLGNAKVTFTNAGNVGIGTTSPASFQNYRYLQITGGNDSQGGVVRLTTSAGTYNAEFYTESSGSYLTSSGLLGFYTAGSERMRITSGGELFVGATTQPGAGNATTGACFGPSGYIIGQRNAAAVGYFGRGTDNGQLLVFYRGTTEVGSISVTTVLTTYNTTSDYRLKEDLKPINGLDIVNRIKVYDYKWKSEDSRMNGVLAHELAEVLPYAVTGIKDGEQMQSVDYSKIVPVMVQAIKELKAELDTLKNK